MNAVLIYVVLAISLNLAAILSKNVVHDQTNDCFPFILQTNEYTNDPRFRASVGNGHLGAILYHSVFHVNGFYNGHRSNSTYAKVPNPISFRILYDNSTTSLYSLNMFDGVFSEHLISQDFNSTTRIYAHQVFKSIMVVEVDINVTVNSQQDVSIKLESLSLNNSNIDDMIILTQWKNDSYTYLQLTPLNAESADKESPNVTVISTTVPNELIINKSQKSEKFTFIFAATVNNDELAWRDFALALKLEINGSLLTVHKEAWNNLWMNGGRIDIEGNCSLAKTVHASFYYIISSLPMTPSGDMWPFFGLCPSSLAQVDITDEMYWGHVFWDQETWMLPGLLIFYPDVIKRVLKESRFTKMNSAQEKAKRMGYNGSMFPWESAYTGEDTSNWPAAVLREVHITGDIALSMQQYLYFTNDTNFVLFDGAYEVFLEIAKFWISRLTYQSDTDTYGVYDGMGPDEHHDHVNNSAYLNAIAQLSLRLPNEIYSSYIVTNDIPNAYHIPDSEWLTIADKVYIPFDYLRQFHPEFDGFVTNETIKQADVVLLGFPLMLNMTENVRENDLNIYENLTSIFGPAMTWSMHTIGWLEVNQKRRADSLFDKNFEYIREPFKIWTENTRHNPDPGAVNFITGMGGFIQSLLYGYYGLRVYVDRLEIKPTLIPCSIGYTISSMKYMGNVFDSSVTSTSFNITLKKSEKACQFQNMDTGNVIPFQTLSNLNFAKYSIKCTKSNKSIDIYPLIHILFTCIIFVFVF